MYFESTEPNTYENGKKRNFYLFGYLYLFEFFIYFDYIIYFDIIEQILFYSKSHYVMEVEGGSDSL